MSEKNIFIKDYIQMANENLISSLGGRIQKLEAENKALWTTRNIAVDEIDKLTRQNEILRAAVNWYWAHRGTNNAELKSSGYHISSDALQKAGEIRNGVSNAL